MGLVHRTRILAVIPYALALALCMSGTAFGQEPELPPDTLISLQLEAGYGVAPPGYTVTVNADGLVTYQGEGSVRVTARQTARIPTSSVSALLAEAERIGFFALKDGYGSIDNGDGTYTTVSHRSTVIVTVTARGRTKRVENSLGAPESLGQFQRAIYKATGIQRWVFFDEQTLEELVQTGWSARTDEGAIYLQEAIRRDEVSVARRLIELGADIRGWVRQRIPPLLSAESGAMVDVLVKAGADPHERRGDMGPMGTPLMAAASKDGSVAAALLKAGARLEEYDDNGHTALWFAACAANPDVVRVLLAAGANPRGSATTTSALDCAREIRQSSELRWRRVGNQGHPTDQEIDEVVAMLTKAAEQQRQRK